MARQAMELGAVDYLEKGTPLQGITDAVRRAAALNGAPVRQSGPSKNVVEGAPDRSGDAAELLALVRHELAAPLTSALGLARLLHEAPEALGDKQGDALRRVLGNLERLQALVESFEELARIHEGRLELDGSSRVDLTALLEDAVAEFHDRHPDRHVTLDVHSAFEIQADPSLLARAIQNLLSNADKFSPPEAPLEVGATTDEGTVIAWVRDHGPGIPPEKIERVFDRFVRLDHRAKGLGIGLYLTKTIIEAHGGRIRAENHPDGGARFSILLPLRHAEGYSQRRAGELRRACSLPAR